MGSKYQDSPILGRFGGQAYSPRPPRHVPGGPWVWSLGPLSSIPFLHIHKQKKNDQEGVPQVWAPPPTSDFPQSQTSTCQGSGPHWLPPPKTSGLATSAHGLHYNVGTPTPCTRGRPRRLIAPRGPLTRVREGMPGDRRWWANSTCRSRVMRTIGADRSRAPASATWPGEAGARSIEIPAFLGGGLACTESPRGVEFWGPLAPFFLHIPKQKKITRPHWLPSRHRTNNRGPQCPSFRQARLGEAA